MVSSVREVTGADGRLVTTNEVFAPGPDGRARLVHTFSERTWDRLVANGLDPAVLGRWDRAPEGRWA